MTNSRCKASLLGIILLLPGISAAQTDIGHILIVKSSDNSYFNESIETLIDHVDTGVEYEIVMATDLTAAFDPPRGTSLFIALGQSAVEAVNRLDDKANVYNAYLTEEQYLGLDIANQVTVLLDQPLYRYLGFCKLMLMVNSIGVITDRPVELDQRQSSLLQDLDIELNQYRLDPLNKLLPVLRKLLQQNDVLLMLPRQAIYNRDTAKGVLLASYRSRRPAISYSPAHVKAGALASIYSSPVDIGRHLAILINQKLQDPARRHPAFQFARFYSITSNRRVARALGIELPSEKEIRLRLDALNQ